jgi:salicylate hydroxylase
MPAPQLHIAIVGAGLGGLAAAIGIAKAGHKATILEQASALREVCIASVLTYHVLIT